MTGHQWDRIRRIGGDLEARPGTNAGPEPQSGVVARLGGKGAGLARLSALGLPVPEAFVVTADAFREALGPLADEAERRAAELDPDEHGFAARCAEIRESLRRGPAHEGVFAEIAQAYEQLGASVGAPARVAVRSSSVAEDSADASFAGGHDSYLGVVGADEVVEKVRCCWASLYTDRAVAYRRETSSAVGAMAVVVQSMVPAETAGVLMTLNPVTGDRSIIVVESVWGLGEPLVSGEACPDRFVLDKITGEIRRREIVPKPHRVVQVPPPGSGTAGEPVPEHLVSAASLSDERLLELRAHARSAERLLGGPVDIEFAVAGAQVQLLQVRPETVWSRRPAADRPAARSVTDLVAGTLTGVSAPAAANPMTGV